ncbi:hypothetical protein PINS_up004062 [Pythium insidiosum]|nr:hypothetical protein PINS_up004062 [Pythium insidiosum]
MRSTRSTAAAAAGHVHQSKKATAASAARAATKSTKAATTTTTHVEWRGKRITAFEKRVYELISTIPAGKVSTYGDVAKALQSGPRPVGQALRKNPFAPQVPCHRVVSASLGIGGFKGATGEASPCIVEKRELLSKEGVTFTDDLKITSACLHSFTAS